MLRKLLLVICLFLSLSAFSYEFLSFFIFIQSFLFFGLLENYKIIFDSKFKMFVVIWNEIQHESNLVS